MQLITCSTFIPIYKLTLHFFDNYGLVCSQLNNSRGTLAECACSVVNLYACKYCDCSLLFCNSAILFFLAINFSYENSLCFRRTNTIVWLDLIVPCSVRLLSIKYLSFLWVRLQMFLISTLSVVGWNTVDFFAHRCGWITSIHKAGILHCVNVLLSKLSPLSSLLYLNQDSAWPTEVYECGIWKREFKLTCFSVFENLFVFFWV